MLSWRDAAGPEVDWVLEKEGLYIPIKVKWTNTPINKDIRHLKTFLSEYHSETAYLVCRVPHRLKLADNIFAIPWQQTDTLADLI